MPFLRLTKCRVMKMGLLTVFESDLLRNVAPWRRHTQAWTYEILLLHGTHGESTCLVVEGHRFNIITAQQS